MPISIEEAQAFVSDAEKAREEWLSIAERSWWEIKKRQKNGKPWSMSPNSTRRRSKYPAWYSIFKIRQPLLLSRIGIPIGKDTTQDGNDNIGATAAICIERLAVNLARSFNFFDVMAAARDDFLATNFAIVRAYYERDEIKERVKEYITPQQMPDGQMMFVDSQGMITQSDNIMQDDEGYFVYHDEVVDVENEKVCLEHVLYKNIYVDPGITRWGRCKRLGFAEFYSEREFKETFGAKALLTIPREDDQKQGGSEASPKNRSIKVIEYWDAYDKECVWFVDGSKEFIEPLGYMVPNDDEDEEYQELNGLYDLEKLFPVPEPLIINAATDEFYPTPEYFQLVEIFEDIHTIFARMVALTRAVRARLLYDNNIEGLQAALNEANEGDAFGVDNLAQSLSTAGGSLENVVQYIPVEKLIQSLANMYTALEQRLNVVYKLTGTSDLLQGLITDPTQRTFGERQMTEKYALNQLAEPQRKMQEFVRDSYELLVEMALKNFKEASLDQYIMPQTMQPEDQQRYRAALGMLKANRKRFRIELETDSTIALNEEYDKKMRIELVNTLTQAMEKTAGIAQTSPALIIPELHCLKYLIQGFRQGKMFQSEITQAIDNVIQQAEQARASAVPPFNKDETMAKLKGQELQASNQLRIAELQSNEKIEIAKLQQNQQIASIESQLEQFKLQMEQGAKSQDIQLKYTELNAEIGKAQAELQIKRDELLVELRKVTDKKEIDQFQVMMEQQFKPYEQQLEAYKLQIDEAELQLKRQDQALVAQDQSFQAMNTQVDNMRQEMRMKMEAAELMHEMRKPPEMPPITINMPEPKSRKKKIKVNKDEFGNVTDYEASDVETPKE